MMSYQKWRRICFVVFDFDDENIIQRTRSFTYLTSTAPWTTDHHHIRFMCALRTGPEQLSFLFKRRFGISQAIILFVGQMPAKYQRTLRR